MKHSKAYPYLKALLDGLIEAAPNWAKAPGKFAASLSDQLKNKDQEENKQLEEEISGISEEELRKIVKEAGCEQKEDIELIVGSVKLVPEILRVIDYRFDKLDEKLEEIEKLLQRERPVFSIEKQETGRDSFQAAGDINITYQLPSEKTEEKEGKKAESEHKPAKEKVKALWPEGCLPFDGPKVSEPFAGREKELEELGKAMGKGKGVVAVVGMAGQGKSCLAGEWCKRGARPPKGVGMFWRKVYEAGYTFDRFLDEFYMYLMGEDIDRQRFNSIKKRAILVDSVFKDKPCWVVLDGVERWLKRWSEEPDAGAEKLSIDDRAGQEEILGKFLKGASWWDNGSRLLLTTRAVPSALDENPPIMIGKKRERERRLEDLRPEEAAELLEELGVKGDREIMREAAGAYGNHPYAVHVLGVLIHDLYGGDVSKWEEVSPMKEKRKGLDIGVLFEKIIEHRKEDLGLLELVASSVGPAPVDMLEKMLGQEEASIRRRLAELARWQMVEFKGTEAEQHSLVRKFLTERLGEEGTKGTRRQIAGWWAERQVPARPVKIDDIRPLLKAVEHLLAARDPDAATDIFLTKPSADSYYTVDEWLWRFGYLDEDIRICGEAIRVYKELVEKENRLELRNDLASCYNNRGTAYSDQGRLSEAIADYGKAIEIREELVEKENRRELRWDLWSSLFNRAAAYSEEKKWKKARTDIEKGANLLRGLIEEGQRHVIGSFLQTAGFSCKYAKELGEVSEAAEWANAGMRWFMEEVEAKRENEVLLKAAAGFIGGIKGNAEVLLKNGLDEKLLESLLKILTEKLDNLKVSPD